MNTETLKAAPASVTTPCRVAAFRAGTTTKKGLAVRSRLDDRIYAKGRRVSDKQLALVNIEPHAFHGEWNYTIHPTAAA